MICHSGTRPALAALMVLVGLGAVPAGARAQSAATPADSVGLVARTFELRARPGLDRQLDQGYQRHLDWHARAGERWSWYLWQITNGDRAGWYVDGTFGHAWADFDQAVDPAGDSEDNALNVEPFAVRGANQVWRLRVDLGPADRRAIDPAAAPWVLRTELRLRPGTLDDFVQGIGELRRALGPQPYAVYELAAGGESPRYVIWLPAGSWAELGALADRVAAARRRLDALADAARTELWRFRPDLSLCRGPVRCYRTLQPE